MYGTPETGSRTIPPRAAAVIAELRIWEEKEFGDSEAEWQRLLSRSSADRVFMSWHWQWTWWRHYGARLKSELHVIAAYSSEGQLVGVAPLHRRRAAHRRPISATRLEIIGSTWRDGTGAYSEYLDFVVDAHFEQTFLDALAGFILSDRRWSDFVVANVRGDSLAARFAREHLSSRCYVREADPVTAHLALLPEDFAEYLQTLHSSARRKLWGHRARLQNAQFTCVGAGQAEGALDLLNGFHQQRWGSQLFLGTFRGFHLDFARLWARRNLLRLSILTVEGVPISVMYNVRTSVLEYNMQSGFDSSINGISPGYLHFGFCIEQACADGIRGFDFMAGDGRTRDYKRDFITKETTLVTMQCVRTRPLAWLYQGYDRRMQRASGAGSVAAP